MASITRSAKSSSDWGISELEGYHIELHAEDTLAFFGGPLPQPSVDPELLTVESAFQMTGPSNKELVHLLNLANEERGKSVVRDFAISLLRATGYVHAPIIPRSRYDIPLDICGERRHTWTDVALLDLSHNYYHHMLVVQVDKIEQNATGYPQLIAQAIATFAFNNGQRVMKGDNEVEEAVIPGILMRGTMPTFYKIPVSKDLERHVRQGTYPPFATRVTYCNPIVGLDHRGGMKQLANRRVILQCYEAFKAIVGV